MWNRAANFLWLDGPLRSSVLIKVFATEDRIIGKQIAGNRELNGQSAVKAAELLDALH